jgi:hypothetical protein
MADFDRTTFCGASVRDIKSSLGWGGQKSSLDVALVEDTEAGDLFVPPLPGTPIWLTIPGSNFKFFGLMQSYNKSNDLSGWPTFNVRAEDAREILDGTHVIMGGYNGVTSSVSNLLNAFGYWENTLGFGGAEANESGMPWYKVKSAIEGMTALVDGTPLGGPLSYRGYQYKVDLSDIPVPPIYYRLGGNEASLMSIIQQICEDAVCEFFIELQNTSPLLTIKVRTASKRYEPPLGSIASFVETQTNLGQVVRSATGLENRNDITSSFCVGGQVQRIYIGSVEDGDIMTFWGFDANGNPITGSGEGIEHEFIANCQEVADIVGDIVYPCKIVELLAALSSNGNATWMRYMLNSRRAEYNFMRLGADVGNPALQQWMQGGQGPRNPNDIRPMQGNILDANGRLVGQLTPDALRQERMFNFVRKLANEYLGKQYLVILPTLFFKHVPESTQIVFSEEVADSGYTDDGEPPLDLPFIYENTFKTEDGKYTAFVKFAFNPGADFRRMILQGNTYVIDSATGEVYVKCHVDPKPVFLDAETPCARITLAGQVWATPVDPTGAGNAVVRQFLHGGQINEVDRARIAGRAGGIPGGDFLHPPPINPDEYAIAMRSNIETYGPWYAAGVPGRIQFISDNSLTPWNYGGFDNMVQAGVAKVVNALSNMVYSESGSLEIPGLPAYNLGDTLEANGPNITDISIQYSTDRVSTTYRLQTYTQRFGIFSRDNDRRMQRLARNNNQTRALLRQALESALKLNVAGEGAVQAHLESLLQFQRRPVRAESPHAFISGLAEDNHVIMTTCESTPGYLGVACGYPDNFDKTGGMSFDGLFRPFQTLPGYTGGVMPHYSDISAIAWETSSANVMTNNSLNPFGSKNDIELLIRGTGAGSANDADLHNYWIELNGLDPSPTAGTRPVALRAPLVLCGYGNDLQGNFIPSHPTAARSTYSSWKVGSTDFLFDQYRGIWTMHDLIFGQLTAQAPANASGAVALQVWGNAASNPVFNINVKNRFSTPVPSGTKIVAGYFMHFNEWLIIAADCVP